MTRKVSKNKKGFKKKIIIQTKRGGTNGSDCKAKFLDCKSICMMHNDWKVNEGQFEKTLNGFKEKIKEFYNKQKQEQKEKTESLSNAALRATEAAKKIQAARRGQVARKIQAARRGQVARMTARNPGTAEGIDTGSGVVSGGLPRVSSTTAQAHALTPDGSPQATSTPGQALPEELVGGSKRKIYTKKRKARKRRKSTKRRRAGKSSRTR